MFNLNSCCVFGFISEDLQRQLQLQGVLPGKLLQCLRLCEVEHDQRDVHHSVSERTASERQEDQEGEEGVSLHPHEV